MLLTITNTYPPATDLGYLLYKHPERVQEFELNFGHAHVFYPEASIDRCTAALTLDVDPIKLVRNRKNPAGSGFSLQQYVNDRPYVASSFLSVAIAKIFAPPCKADVKNGHNLLIHLSHCRSKSPFCRVAAVSGFCTVCSSH